MRLGVVDEFESDRMTTHRSSPRKEIYASCRIGCSLDGSEEDERD
jgi:hypothetical protein